jgi:hypothetical protein
MAVKSSGQLSLSEIQTEFGGNVPHGITEYYALEDGAGLPASGPIEMSDFYSKYSDHTGTENRVIEPPMYANAGSDEGHGNFNGYPRRLVPELKLDGRIFSSLTITMSADLDYGCNLWVRKNSSSNSDWGKVNTTNGVTTVVAGNAESNVLCRLEHGPSGRGSDGPYTWSFDGTSQRPAKSSSAYSGALPQWISTANDVWEFGLTSGQAWSNDFDNCDIHMSFTETIPNIYKIDEHYTKFNAGTHSWTAPSGVSSVIVDIIGGGGGGSGAANRQDGNSNYQWGGGGGGGGSGGRNETTVSVNAGSTYSIVVGSGGSGSSGTAYGTDSSNGSDGGNSSAFSITSNGGQGGRGVVSQESGSAQALSSGRGGNGGSPNGGQGGSGSRGGSGPSGGVHEHGDRTPTGTGAGTQGTDGASGDCRGGGGGGSGITNSGGHGGDADGARSGTNGENGGGGGGGAAEQGGGGPSGTLGHAGDGGDGYVSLSWQGTADPNDYIAATGGSIITDGDYKIHKFESNGTFAVQSLGSPGYNTAEILISAGGGGGGGDIGGGGGGGGTKLEVIQSNALAPDGGSGYSQTVTQSHHFAQGRYGWTDNPTGPGGGPYGPYQVDGLSTISLTGIYGKQVSHNGEWHHNHALEYSFDNNTWIHDPTVSWIGWSGSDASNGGQGNYYPGHGRDQQFSNTNSFNISNSTGYSQIWIRINGFCERHQLDVYYTISTWVTTPSTGSHSVTVGGGGSGSTGTGSQGGTSSFGSLYSLTGGGAGGSSSGNSGSNGGSGGGSGGSSGNGQIMPGISGQGHAGGISPTNSSSGGGGGKGGPGSDGVFIGGHGGSSFIGLGHVVGGGGSGTSNSANGGVPGDAGTFAGGGGSSGNNGLHADQYHAGGGGGGGDGASTGGNGGSGVVLVKYRYQSLVPTYIAATGGTITYDGDYKIHTFTANGTFNITQLGTQQNVETLVIAGGGGGGHPRGGGGGAGGYRFDADLSVTQTSYSISVGSGGAGAAYDGGQGSDGNNSVFNTITSTGGGGGAGDHTGNNGRTGGSGGGAFAGPGTGGSGNAGSYTPVEGYDGGSSSTNLFASGGGGGAGSVGGPQSGNNAGAGGSGRISSITGSSITRGGGGGGGAHGSGGGGAGIPGAGGSGGGGRGGTTGAAGYNGTANTGGGGGGGAASSGVGRTGGSGIVIIRYRYQ